MTLALLRYCCAFSGRRVTTLRLHLRGYGYEHAQAYGELSSSSPSSPTGVVEEVPSNVRPGTLLSCMSCH